MTTSNSNTKLRVKLLIDKKNQKVLFAEAGKEFVDFLFSLMSLPLGTVIRLLTKKSMVGCLGKLYESIESLSETFLQPTQDKASILMPRLPICDTNYQSPLLLSNTNEPLDLDAYVCINLITNTYSDNEYGYGNQSSRRRTHHLYVAKDDNSLCPDCNNVMSSRLTYVAPAPAKKTAYNEGGGFVKGVATYMIMDDLEVKPMSAISSITSINKFNVTDLSSVEEKEVDMGVTEGLKLLKESLQSENVLTNVFLHSKLG